MDGLKPGKGSRSDRTHSRSKAPIANSQSRRHDAERYFLVRSIGKIASKQRKTLWKKFQQTEFAKWPDKTIRNRVYSLSVLSLFVFSSAAALIQPYLNDKFYNVTEVVRGVLPKPTDTLATYLTYDAKKAQFLYNDGYGGAGTDALAKTGQGDPRISAAFYKEPSKGMQVSDELNKVDFKLTPKFKLNVGKQDKNQVFYQLVGESGYLVYTSQIASVKEDIVLEKSDENKKSFAYELGLTNGLEARLEKNGSIGVYGSSLPINGDVSTGNEKDAELLKKARDSSEKNKLLFVIPAPVVVESGKDVSSVRSWFELTDGKNVTLHAEGLSDANYPLSIDPSVYVESAAQLMRGNNETNVEFDVATEQFKKASTTGARIDSWTDTTDGPAGVWGQSSVAAGGYVYSAGGYTSRVQPRIKEKKVTTQATASTNYVISMPDTRPAGDLYVAIIADAVNSGASNVSPPGGWTQIADTRAVSAFYRVGVGSEPATYTWTSPTSSQYSATILRITDFDSAVLAGTAVTASNTSTTPIYTTNTPNDNGTLQITAAAFTNANIPNSFATSANYYEVASGISSPTPSTATAGFVAQTSEMPIQSGVASGGGTFTAVGVASGYGSTNFFIKGSVISQAISNTVYWAKFNSVNGSVESPAPGSNGTACSGWCTNAAYNLPVNNASTSDGAGLWGASMVAYNGYLYYLGGNDGTVQKSTVYVAKLGANGEPQLWHPSDPVQANWVYWNKMSTGLPATLAHMSTVAYDGKMYIVGGDDNNTQRSGAVATVYYADILPNGTLGTITATTALPSITKFATAQAYNGYVYAMGGAANGTLIQDDVSGGTGRVLYSKIQSDGSLGAWNYAAADGSHLGFTTPRFSLGGTMSAISGGYMYITGGCKTYTPSPNDTKDNCDAFETSNDVQLASINADGTLDSWNTIIGLRNFRFGSSLIAWQDSLYRIGGCTRQAIDTGACYAAQLGVQYGNINQDGDASTVSISTDSGSGTCTGSAPYNCSLPPGGTGAAQGGQALSSTLILNGYLYVIGGCTTNACTTMSDNISYAAIDSSGRLKNPPSCPDTTYGAWCVDNTNTIAGGVGAAGSTIFNNTIYLVGGQDGGGGTNAVYRNGVNSDGSLTGAWSSQQLSGTTNLNAASVSYTYAYSRANPSDATYPGNLYMFGGCTAPATAAGCTAGNNYSQNVYKCKITTSGALGTGILNGCTTTGQLPIGTVSGGLNPGLGIHAGTVYANYIYLIGGVADGASDLKTVRYAKFDNNNNVVAASGSTWVESSIELNQGRRRGAAFGYNGYLYSVGGYDASVTSVLDSIEFVKVNVSDGSLISTNAAAPTKFKQSAVTINQRWGLGVAVSNSYAYVIGGCKDGASPTCNAAGLDNTIQTFQIYNNDSGAPGGYTSETDLFASDRIGGSSVVHNGYIYIAGGCISPTDCTDATNSVQYAAIDSYGGIGTWSAGGNLPADRAWGQLEVAGGALYYLGGQDDTATNEQATVYYTTGISSGNPTWNGTAATRGIGDTGGGGQARTKFSAAVWNNRIYVVGGLDGGAAASAAVYISPQLNSGGDIASVWTSSTAFNVARSGATAITYANNLYVLGGYTGSLYLSDVQFARLDSSNGTVGSWSYTTSLPTLLAYADGYAVNGYMYLFGGRSSTNDCTPRTLLAPVSANTTIVSGNNPTGIGEWYQTNRNYDSGRYGAAATYANGKAYVLGGGCQGILMKDDFDSTIDATMWAATTGFVSDTTCQSTSTTKTLRSTNGSASVADTKTIDTTGGGTVRFKLYVPQVSVGGCTQPNALDEDIVLRYSTNGGTTYPNTLATYQENGPYDPITSIAANIPAGAQGANVRFRWTILNAEASDMFALDDVEIVGTTSTDVTLTDASRVVITPLLSQPQVAVYTRLIDAGKDVFPTKWLLNGLDNSIGARWQFAYRSMNDTTVTDTSKACGGSVMTSYGALTNFGDVTLASPQNYIVKNSGGTDIGCSRYFFMNVSIDASKTYGYPDDISRGPTIDNLTLFFKANPGSRLIHGKTFIEGTQQPLDTQPGP